MSVAISWANKMQLAKCDIMVSFPISSHIFLCIALLLSFTFPEIGDYTIRELIYGVQDTTAVDAGPA